MSRQRDLLYGRIVLRDNRTQHARLFQDEGRRTMCFYIDDALCTNGISWWTTFLGAELESFSCICFVLLNRTTNLAFLRSKTFFHTLVYKFDPCYTYHYQTCKLIRGEKGDMFINQFAVGGVWGHPPTEEKFCGFNIILCSCLMQTLILLLFA